ncbi:MAG: hypothetical protein IPK04_19060 [Bdellovibrionales bacterium]|nr:hypothetical protein [Bdellovibrionales bacterium]
MLLAAIVALTFSGGAVQAGGKTESKKVECGKTDNGARHAVTTPGGQAKSSSATEAYRTATANSRK